jgi:phosphoesterase RecJ-like protein
MTFKEIIKIIEESQANNILLLCHQNSDPDAVCSAYAFQELLKKIKPNLKIEIGTGEGVSRLARNLLRFLPIYVNLNPNIDNAQMIVLLDTNTVQQLGPLAEKVTRAKIPIIVIDHHSAHPETMKLCTLCITNEEASSTCDIIYDFYKEENLKPQINVAKALFLGMAFDTRHFVLANSSTFKAVADIVDSGVIAPEVLSMLAMPMDFSERVARIKACRRAKVVRIDKWIIALSQVSAFQASAARALIDIGAHVSAVAGQKDNRVEISLRCTREFAKNAHIHLGKDVAKKLGEFLDGQGGGHAMAAGVNGKGNLEAGLNYCLNLLKDNLTKNK